jgi:hypothetical protein
MRVFILIACMLAAGCTRMSVEVAILDGEYRDSLLSGSGIAGSRARSVAARIRNGDYNKKRLELKNSIDKAYEELVKANMIAKSDRQTMQNSVDSAIDERISEARTLHEQALSAKDEESARELFRKGDDRLAELVRQVTKEIEGTGVNLAANTPVANAAASVKNTAAKLEGFLSSDSSILSDSNAPFVAGAPEEKWHGVYNETFGNAFFGNHDIAIKMESLGNFTLKGMRVDARQATQAMGKIVKSGVRMIAAAYGLPLPSASTGDAQAAKEADVQVSEDVAGADQKKRLAEARLDNSRQAAASIMDAIAAHYANATNASGNVAPDQQKTARSAIQKAFETNKPLLAGEGESK